MKMLSYNGKVLPEDEFSLSPRNRAFLYGDGVFETIRVAAGKVLWASYHFDRINYAAGKLHFNTGSSWSLTMFENAVIELADAAHGPGSNARVRFSLFREEGGLYAPFTNNASYLIESEELDIPNYTLNNKGLLTDVYPEISKPLNALADIKSINAQLYVLAGIYKRDKGLGDVILLNQEGHVAEAGSSNIFLVRKNRLITPAADQGAVDGIMRRVILQLASDHDIPVAERVVSTADLESADEIFLTNAIHGIRWVMGFRQKRYYNSFSRQIMRLLNAKVKAFLSKERTQGSGP